MSTPDQLHAQIMNIPIPRPVDGSCIGWSPAYLEGFRDARHAAAELALAATAPLEARIAELEKDAARYRWLREQHTYQEEFADQGSFRWFVMAGREPVPCDPGSLDDEIDAAMKDHP